MMMLVLIEILGSLLFPVLGLVLYSMGYEAGRQATQGDWMDRDNADAPVVMEHTHGGDQL